MLLSFYGQEITEPSAQILRLKLNHYLAIFCGFLKKYYLCMFCVCTYVHMHV